MKSIFKLSIAAIALAVMFSQSSFADSVDLHLRSGGVSVGIDIGTPPPARVVEVVPEPRAGHIWVPGFWAWEGQRHVWVKGTWERERPGYAYEPGRWEQRGDRWHFEPGNWKEQRVAERRGEERRVEERKDERRNEEVRHEEHRHEREERRDNDRY